MKEYLASAPVIDTHNLEEAREAVTRIYLEHDLLARKPEMHMRLNADKSRHMTLGYLRYQTDIDVTMPATEPAPPRVPPFKVIAPVPVAEPAVLEASSRPSETVVPPV